MGSCDAVVGIEVMEGESAWCIVGLCWHVLAELESSEHWDRRYGVLSVAMGWLSVVAWDGLGEWCGWKVTSRSFVYIQNAAVIAVVDVRW